MKRKLMIIIVGTLVLSLAMTFSLVSCQSEEEPEEEVMEEVEEEPVEGVEEVEEEPVSEVEEPVEEETEEPAEEEPKEILFAAPVVGMVPIWDIAYESFEKVCETYGYNGEVKGPNEIDANKVIEIMETGIAQGVDAMIAVPFTYDMFYPIFEKVLDAGILWVESGSTMGDDVEGVLSYAGTDWSEYGRIAAEKVAESSSEKANVLFMDQRPGGNVIFDTAVTSFEESMDENTEVIGREYAENDPIKCSDLTRNFLTANPETNFIICFSNIYPLAIVEVLDDMDKSEDVKILAIDLEKEVYEAIKDGKIWATMRQNFEAWGSEPVEQLHNYWTGEAVQRIVDTGTTFIDENNIEDFEPIVTE